MKTKLILILFLLISMPLLAEEPESVNIALGKSVQVSGGTGASNLTDGDLSSFWDSAVQAYQDATIDLGDIYEITKVVIHWANGTGCGTYQIRFGFINGTWEGEYALTNRVIEEKTVYEFDTPFRGRYVLLNLRGRLEGTVSYQIAEIEIYGTPYVNMPEEQASIDLLTERLLEGHINNTFNDNDVKNQYDTIREDGSWSDVDYNDRTTGDGWHPLRHLTRLIVMSEAFRNEQSSWYMNMELVNKIEKGLLYFKDNREIDQADNWWQNDIGDPRNYMVSALLIKGYISKESLLSISSYLRDQTSRFAGAGKNLTWIAEISIFKGCIEDNVGIIKKGFDAIASTLVIVPNKGNEGIKVDGSFHQHGSLLYSGGYGMSITEDISKYMQICAGTVFAENVFTKEKRELFSDMLLNGHRLFGYRQVVDFGILGRGIATNTSNDPTNISTVVLDRMVNEDPENAEDYVAWKNHIEKEDVFPAPGNKHFWKSDIMTQHGENYYLSARIISKRTRGTECLNNENKKGYNLPLGATNILTSGKEYHGIYPMWDWSRIPGTTAAFSEDETTFVGYLEGENQFGGGVSNGNSGIMSYGFRQGEKGYKGLQARKSYFFIDDMMFCMGTDIKATHSIPVVTSVNQCFLQGNVNLYTADGEEKTLMNTRRESLEFSNLKWAYHDRVGYIFPENKNITVENHFQEGAWRDIYTLGSATKVRDRVFSLWINHGVSPTEENYQYIVVPDKTLQEFKEIAANPGFVIVRNDEKVHALRKGNKFCLVFYEAGTVTFDNGLTVNSNKRALILLEVEDKRKFKISLADPTYSESQVTLTINREFEGVTLGTNGNSAIRFAFPSGDYTGSTWTETFISTKDETWSSISKSEIEESIAIYPNPVEDETVITFDPGVYSSIECLTMDGKLLQQIRLDCMDTEKVISLNGYNAGIYLIRMTGQRDSVVSKIIKL